MFLFSENYNNIITYIRKYSRSKFYKYFLKQKKISFINRIANLAEVFNDGRSSEKLYL